jgi:hypothetical protein
MAMKNGKIEFDFMKETRPLFKPSQIHELYQLGERFPLLYLIADLVYPAEDKDENRLPKDLGILSLDDMRDVFRWQVTEENHTRHARLLAILAMLGTCFV